MTDDRPPLNPNRSTSKSAAEYLDQYGAIRAVTKAEHDRRVAATGRPFTADGVKLRRPSRTLAGVSDDGNFHNEAGR